MQRQLTKITLVKVMIQGWHTHWEHDSQHDQGTNLERMKQKVCLFGSNEERMWINKSDENIEVLSKHSQGVKFSSKVKPEFSQWVEPKLEVSKTGRKETTWATSVIHMKRWCFWPHGSKDAKVVTCYNVSESWGHYTKWNKPITKDK